MRTASWIRTGYGTILFVWPRVATRLVASERVSLAGRTVVRVLGLREAGQALVCAPRPTADVLRLGAGVDVLHAATMLALATRGTKWRRPALISMAVAASFAAIALSEAGSVPRNTAGSLRTVGNTDVRLLDRLLKRRDQWARSGFQAFVGGL